MFDRQRLQDALVQYKRDFLIFQWKNERYKWEAIHTILSIKDYQIWDGFFALAKLNGGRRSSATLTGMKQRQDGKDTQR